MVTMSLVIFDFDGTLVDSYKVSLEAVNAFCKLRGIPEVQSLSDMQNDFWKILLRYNIRLFGVKRFVLNYLAEHIVTCPMPNNLNTILKELHARSHTFGIISSNREKTVQQFLKHQHLEHMFSFIMHAGWSQPKSLLLKRIIHAEKSPKNRSFYVCDRVDDVTQAQPNLLAIAVSWGYDSKETLQAAEPYYLISKPEELLVIPELLQA